MVVLENMDSGKKKATARGYYIGDKLMRLLKQKNITPYKLAKLTGISQPAISMIVNNKRAASPEKIEIISKVLGVSPSYFIEEEPPEKAPLVVMEKEYVVIPIISGVGTGGELVSDHYTLIRRADLSRRTISAFEAYGDSMEPTIPEGYIVLIDPYDKELIEGKVYLFVQNDGAIHTFFLLRRVMKIGDEWYLVPDNRKYKPTKLTEFYMVIGKAIKKLPPIKPEDID